MRNLKFVAAAGATIAASAPAFADTSALDTVTSAISFTDITAGVMSIAAAGVVLWLAIGGAKQVYSMMKRVA